MIVFVLKYPGFGTHDIGNTLEWIFYATLPNFCFCKSLQDLVTMHTFTKMCGGIDEGVCEWIRRNRPNETNLCCPGESYLLLVSASKL